MTNLTNLTKKITDALEGFNLNAPGSACYEASIKEWTQGGKIHSVEIDTMPRNMKGRPEQIKRAIDAAGLAYQEGGSLTNPVLSIKA